jgi:hypothetical protein
MLVDPPRRTWRRKLLALALALLASLLVGEILVRVVVGVPFSERLPVLFMRANPSRGWEMVPGTHYTYHHPVHVGELGLRGPELEAKAEGELRMLALGDSLIYGQGVGDEETLPHYLGESLRMLDSAGRPWSAVNAGHRSYDTRQELALLEELGPAIQPDVVVVFWYWNDLIERDIEKTYTNLKERGEVSFDTGDRVEGWNRVNWYAHELLRRSALLMFVHDLRRRSDPLRLVGDLPLQEGFERLGGYFDRLQRLGVEAGFVPLLAVIPDANALAGPHQSQDLDQRALVLARERGLACVDLRAALEPLLEKTGKLPVIPYDGHYAPQANAAMAVAVAEQILQVVED